MNTKSSIKEVNGAERSPPAGPNKPDRQIQVTLTDFGGRESIVYRGHLWHENTSVIFGDMRFPRKRAAKRK